MSKRTILIGLDGATFTILDPLMQAGVMPTLARIARQGVRAELNSVVPPLTPPAWTSLATGRSPGHHGIFDFFLKEQGSAHIRLATFPDIRCETIWSAVSRQGKRVTTLNFPVMLPPPAVAGRIIGGWVPWKQLRLACYPQDLLDQLKMLPGFNSRELAMDMADEQKAIEGCSLEDMDAWVDLHIRREKQWWTIVSWMMDDDPCELTAVLFDGPDKILHLGWRFLDPEMAEGLSPAEQAIRERCIAYFSELDTVLQRLVEKAGPEATVLVASDHGFGAQTETFFVNAWLAEQGYLAWAGETARHGEGDSAELGLNQMARHVYLLDWDKTVAYVSTPSSNGIHIVVADKPGDPGVPRDRYEGFRNELADRLAAIRSSVCDEPLVRRIWTREEAFAGPCSGSAPDLTLGLRDGGLVSILDSDQFVKPRPEPAGTHRPAGVFMAAGPEIRPGAALPPLSILDVAPMTLYTLGLPVPEAFEGCVPAGAFRPGVLEERPVRFEPGVGEMPQDPACKDAGNVLDAEGEAAVAARLRALGYME